MIANLRTCIAGLVLAVRCLASEDPVPLTTSVTSSQKASSLAESASVPISSIAVRSPSRTSSPSDINTSTCPSRTINYVLHTLPQQCLRADWTRSRNSTVPADTPMVAVVNSTTADTTSFQTVAGEPNNSSHTTVVMGTETTDSYISVDISTTTRNQDDSTESDSATASETEVDSPLDTANFLSFEDWKKQNLAKVGQSSENIGQRSPIEGGRKAPIINALDSLGDENEIDLGFTGFGGPKPGFDGESKPANEGVTTSTEGDGSTKVSPALQALRPRDAGRTCKERTNYASFDCAATVLKNNPECKSASSVLVENKDSYMLSKCSAHNKFLIVELCNDILIDTVVLANYEFFSSIFRHFRVSVSDRYPVKAEKWKDLGTFEARNTREVQAFLVENPLIWARYLRIEFLTHYGSEYFCPVSLLRVHGTTMMEEFRNQEELARGEHESIDDEVTEEPQEPPFTVQSSSMPTVATSMPSKESIESNVPSSSSEEVQTDQHAQITPTTSAVESRHAWRKDLITTTSPAISIFEPDMDTCPSDMSPVVTLSLTKIVDVVLGDTIAHPPASTASSSTSSGSDNPSIIATEAGHSSESVSSSEANPLDSQEPSAVLTSSSTSTESVSSSSSANSTSSSRNASPSSSAVSGKESSARSDSANTSKVGSSTTSSLQAQPSTQESFFKSISKRLQQLESNSSLSLQYIEEQSRILRDAFSKVEKRQINMTASFLSNLNNTVMAELAGFRQAYDQLWQSTVIELEGQREQHKHEMTALSSRLTLVVDELVWQKRMGIVQSTLLLLCLALVLFGRNSGGASDASLMQQVMLRSQSAFRSGAGSEANSPAGSRSPVSLFRRKLPLWRRSDPSIKFSDTEPQSGGITSAEDSPGMHAESDVEIDTDEDEELEINSDLDIQEELELSRID